VGAIFWRLMLESLIQPIETINGNRHNIFKMVKQYLNMLLPIWLMLVS
jgi:hypothetical protein